jgi:hypothetical protein
MCIIDRSRLTVFDQNSLDGIIEGAAAARWGGQATCLQALRPEQLDDTMSHSFPGLAHPFPLYGLSGCRVATSQKGLVIARGKKWISR